MNGFYGVRILGAALLVLALFCYPALAFHSGADSSHNLTWSARGPALSSLVTAPRSTPAGSSSQRPARGRLGGLASVLGFLGTLGLGAAVVITQVQPTNQIPTHDTFVADVTMAVADTTATIPHGLGVAPIEVQILPTLQGTAAPIGTVTVAFDATNVVLTKSGAANMAFNFRVIAKKPHTTGM